MKNLKEINPFSLTKTLSYRPCLRTHNVAELDGLQEYQEYT